MQTPRSFTGEILGSYLAALAIGAVSGVTWCLYPFGGPTAGYLVASWAKPIPRATAKHGLLAGLVAAGVQLVTLLGSVGGLAEFDLAKDGGLLAGLAAWTILSCLFTTMIIGRKRLTSEEKETLQARTAALAPAPALVVQVVGEKLAFACPACKSELSVMVTSLKGSGRTAKVPTRTMNIAIYVIVAIVAGIFTGGNLILAVAAGLVAMSTARYWASPVADLLGKAVSISEVVCPHCHARLEVYPYVDTVAPTFHIRMTSA